MDTPTTRPSKAENIGGKPKLTKGQHIAGAVGVGLILVVGVAVLGSGGSGGGGADGPQPELDRIAAELACEDFVADRLKAPSTAEFTEALVSTPLDSLDSSVFIVDGQVDGQNSFGAMIRNRYTCTVQLSPDRSTWTLVSLDGIPQSAEGWQ